jgi:hypothetical protein
MKMRVFKDIPELVEKLRAEKARQKDFISTQGNIQAKATSEGLVFDINRPKDGGLFGAMDQAHQQVAAKLEIPYTYYQRMLNPMKGKDDPSLDLLAENINHWLARHATKKRLVRTVDNQFRAFLSSRYRPINHLDLVTSAVQVITGQEPGDEDKPWAKGARAFDYMMDPKHLDVGFINPCIQVDLNALDKGVVITDPKTIPDDWMKGGRNAGGMCNPIARIRNSETGHGGLYANMGTFEGACLNGTIFGASFTQIHLGKELEDGDLWSPDTIRRINEVVFAKVRDVFRNAFDPEAFLNHCKQFKGLELIKVDSVPDTVDTIVEINGMNEDVRDEILNAYYEITQRRQNLFDVQRAVTASAHAFREADPNKAIALEEYGGRMVEEGEAALAK